ncbi:MAG: scramblase [Actinobacteria bacterium]|nr:scramblase [Actinomycetota bacterium]
MDQTVPLLARPGVGIHQRRKFFELRNEYTLVDAEGQPLGTATQERQSFLALLVRIFSSLDVALPMTLEVRDTTGAVALELHKPWFTWRVRVSAPELGLLGTIRKQIRVGKARFSLEGPSGEVLGEVRARNWRARDFSVHDPVDTEVARVTKEWRGLLTEAFSDADSYAVTFQPQLGHPLRALAFASALAVDIVMKQKDSG